MQRNTESAIRSILATDETIPPAQRGVIINFIKRGGVQRQNLDSRSVPAPAADRILRRRQTGERLGISLRTVDLLAAQGVLKKMKFPGRRRSCGFLESDVTALVSGGAVGL
jgi:predicted DNA-binding transcriptional regulator AlpA